jgi:hypothetical protein
MQYAVLCYHDERIVGAWTKEEDDAVLERIYGVQQRLAQAGGFVGSARLMPTTAATSLRKGEEPLVLDGPFVETKEQLLGFYLIDVENLEAALQFAKELAEVNPGPGGYEVRPLSLFVPGAGLA